jgi:exosome complex component CSL4
MSKAFKEREVLPGDKLSVIEVFQDGRGSYEDDGDIRSTELGRARFDVKKKLVEVEKKTKELVLPKEGLDVVAEAGSVMRRDARVDIFLVDGKPVTATYTGVIHRYDVDREYSRDMGQAMRNGDTVKAKIINTKNRMVQLSVRGPEYGVIYAYCSRCGDLMEIEKGRLHCSKCDRFERRKTAKTYGKEELS